MKNVKILLASILASSLVLSNMYVLPAYANDENTTLNEQLNENTNSEAKTNEDVTAPTIDLNSLKVDKKDCKPGDTVTVSLKASDDSSGISDIQIAYVSQITNSEKLLSLSYNEQTGLYEGTIDIDSYMPNGSWSINYIFLSDYAGNLNSIYHDNYDLSNANFNVERDNDDTKAPTIDLDSLKVDKKDCKPGDTVTVSLKASNDSSGICDIQIRYISQITNNEKLLSLSYNEQTGLYEGTIDIDNYMPNGSWSIDTIYLVDNAGNSDIMYHQDYDFSNANFNVENDNADTKAPTIDLDSLKVDKKDCKPGDTVTVSLKASDDNSGISDIQIYYISKNTNNEKSLSLSYNEQTGLYEATLYIDSSMPNGSWSIDTIYLVDNAGNSDNMYHQDHDFFNANFNVENDNANTTAPTIDLDSL